VFVGAAVSISTDGTTYSTLEAKQLSLKGDNQLKTDRYALGSLTKKEQLQNGLRQVTGQIGLEFNDITAYNRVVNANIVALQAKFQTVDDIETGTKGGFVITCPSVRFDGETPNANNGQIIEHNLNFVVLDDESTATSPLTIDYTTLDTAE
jgi:hypothetical protein